MIAGHIYAADFMCVDSDGEKIGLFTGLIESSVSISVPRSGEGVQHLGSRTWHGVHILHQDL